MEFILLADEYEFNDRWLLDNDCLDFVVGTIGVIDVDQADTTPPDGDDDNNDDVKTTEQQMTAINIGFLIILYLSVWFALVLAAAAAAALSLDIVLASSFFAVVAVVDMSSIQRKASGG